MPTERERIEQWSFGYHLLKAYEEFFLRIYHRFTIVGLEKVPFDETLIFAPNHQNTLMDALVVLNIRQWQPVFLARADIFKKPTVIKILTFLKILPVYRIRDGYQNLQLNDDIFRKTMDVLRNHNGIVILPEGNHFGQRRLRPLKKGIARIAFQAEDASAGNLNIKIIPVGLEYEHYIRFRSKVLIRLGEPIEVKNYLELYRQNPAQAYNALIEELEEKMKREMIHIEDEANYDAYEAIRNSFTPAYLERKKLPGGFDRKFDIDKQLIAKLDTLRIENSRQFNELMADARSYAKHLDQFKLSIRAFPFNPVNYFNLLLLLPLLVIFAPVALYGLVNNIVQIVVPYKLSHKFKDVQFHSSIRHVAALLLTPIMYLIQTLVFWAIGGNGQWALLYLASLPLSAVFLYQWRRYALFSLQVVRIIKVRIGKPHEYRMLIGAFESLYERLEKIIA